MFHWQKLGKIFTPEPNPKRPWMATFAQAPCALLLPDRIRMYFSCRPLPSDDGQQLSHSAFVDLCRENPTKIIAISQHPVLPLGSRGEFDEFGIYPFSAIADGDCIRAYYGGWTRCASVPFNVGIGAAVSHDDGLTFTKIGRGPILPYSPDEPFVLSGPKIRRFNSEWHLFYIAGTKWKADNGRPDPVYKIRHAISSDGVNWQKTNRDIIPSRLEDDEAQASPDVIYYEGRYHMFFCYRYSLDFRQSRFGYRIGYAFSDDLIHWTRRDEWAGISLSESGWDSEMMSYPHVFSVDGTVYMAYLGNEFGKHGFGLAILTGYGSF